MFRSKAIVIYAQRIRDNQSRVILFTKEFGKITTWYKKKDIPESGTIIETLIERRGEINNLISFDNTSCWMRESWVYDEVISLLSLLETLYRGLPEGVSHTGIFHDIENSLEGLIKHPYRSQMLLLIHIRIMKILGYLKDSFYEGDPILSYIYRHVDTSPIGSLEKAKILSQKNKDTIRFSLEEARQNILIS